MSSFAVECPRYLHSLGIAVNHGKQGPMLSVKDLTRASEPAIKI
jgi:hypothetical protein